MKRSRWWIVGVAAVVVVATVWAWRSRSAGATPKYRTATAERGMVEATVSATGTVNPVEQVEVGSQVSGTVSRVLADYNARVRAGQVLLELDPSAFRARVLQNDAAVAKAQAALADAERQLRRARELTGQNVISQADLEAAEVTLAQRRADLQSARAQLDAARVDLAHTVIRAPIDGVVISRAIDLGQTVAASLQAPKLFVIARNLDEMQVETRIDEADIGAIRPGEPVAFTVDAFPDQSFDGVVAQVRLEPVTEQNVVTYTTIVRTGNPGLRLRPGMTANVTVRVARHENVLRVPNAALRFHPATGGRGGRGAAGPMAGFGRGARAMGAGPAGGAMAVRGGGAPTGQRTTDAAHAAARVPSKDQGAARGGAPGAMAGADPERARGPWRGAPGGLGGGPAGGPGMGEWRERNGGPEGRGPGGWRPPGGPGGPPPGGPGEPGDWRARESGPGGGEWRAPGAGAARAWRGRSAAATHEAMAAEGAQEPPVESPLKPGTIYVLRDGRPAAVPVMTGISDGAFTEVVTDSLKPGDSIIVAMEQMVARGPQLQPPPGMGGPQFRVNRPGGGGGGGRGGR